MQRNERNRREVTSGQMRRALITSAECQPRRSSRLCRDDSVRGNPRVKTTVLPSVSWPASPFRFPSTRSHSVKRKSGHLFRRRSARSSKWRRTRDSCKTDIEKAEYERMDRRLGSRKPPLRAGYGRAIVRPIPRAHKFQLLKSLEKITLFRYFFRSNHTVNFQ